MPRPGLPPTPGSSSDIKGEDGTQQLSTLQLSFELPPPAIHDPSRISPSNPRGSPTDSQGRPIATASPSSTYPKQPAETVKARRRSSAAKEPKAKAFALPPPPTRSRKIIQMKPRTQDAGNDSATAKGTAKSTKAATTKAATANKNTVTKGEDAGAATATATADADATDKGKGKKQPSATSAAGRKIARKTAHSLIERRRRSKMNEEFAVLKSMIPACTGEMHKLSILQASIEYVRYLEDCVAKLKAQQQDETQDHLESGRRTPTGRSRLPSIREFHPTFGGDATGAADVDVDMEDSDDASPTPNANEHQPSVSPALLPQDAALHRHQSYGSVSDARRYSYSASAGTSPAFGPVFGGPGYGRADSSAPTSTLTSPALDPQTELDQEAMAALLMLNNDRRGSRGRGLSVRDLLST